MSTHVQQGRRAASEATRASARLAFDRAEVSSLYRRPPFWSVHFSALRLHTGSRSLGGFLGQLKPAELGFDSTGIASPLLLVVVLLVLITDDVGFFEATL